MGWDGDGNVERSDGTRTGSTTWEQARDADQDVNALDHDTHDQDLAEAIENCITRDGQNSPTADLPMGGNKHTGVADADSDSEYATFGQLLALTTPLVAASSVGGTANAITLTPSPSISAHTTGRGFRFFVKTENTDEVTVAISGRPAVSLLKSDGSAFASGELEAGRYVRMAWNGTAYVSDVDPAPEAEEFDLHDDVTTEMTSPAGSDRLVASDEGTDGDPNRWLSLTRLATWLASNLSLAASRISSGTLNINRLPAAARGRTSLYTVGSNGEWTNSTTTFNIPVSDIDDYEYITIAMWAGPGGANGAEHIGVATVLTSVIPEDSTPDTMDTTIGNGAVYLGRNSDGTVLYFTPSGSNTDTGKIMGVWGGAF